MEEDAAEKQREATVSNRPGTCLQSLAPGDGKVEERCYVHLCSDCSATNTTTRCINVSLRQQHKERECFCSMPRVLMFAAEGHCH